ncbi:class I SAM-dependent methyltransferase [Phenylobacterium sp.]|uniref:class I SAM-dependent methyltransferase n=1 Tax=Phenylobacterium sp. TaxID=1871053 RepID=UPI002FC6A277
MRKPLMIARQGRKPTGLLGQVVARIMAKETAPENDIAVELLALEPRDRVLEIGCGHGHTLAKAAALAHQGVLSGVDFSWVMHRYAMRRHRALVRAGRLEFRFGASDQLPYEAGTFDKAFCVHTIYFWTAPLDHLREARRVLKPGGRLVLGFRPAEDESFRATFPDQVYCIRPRAEVVELVRGAGFEILDVREPGQDSRRVVFIVAQAAGRPGASSTPGRHGPGR